MSRNEKRGVGRDGGGEGERHGAGPGSRMEKGLEGVEEHIGREMKRKEMKEGNINGGGGEE